MTLDELVLTPSSLLSILSEIEELKGKDITFVEHDNNIVLTKMLDRLGQAFLSMLANGFSFIIFTMLYI